MAKKFGKFLTFTAIAGIAAGVFYYLKNKTTNKTDFDDFDDEYEDIITKKEDKNHTREYVSINLHPEFKPEMNITNHNAKKVNHTQTAAAVKEDSVAN